MLESEIISKLNKENNFQLSLKVVQFTDDNLALSFISYLNNFHYSTIFIDGLNEAYALLKKAKDEKIDFVIVNNKISFLLPLVSVVSNDDLSIIKPFIPVYYYLKDNIIIQKLKTYCHKSDYQFLSFKTIDSLFANIKELITIH